MEKLKKQNTDNYSIFITEIPKKISVKELENALLNIDNETIREKLINENLWIVKNIILNNFNDRKDKDELMSIGALALVDAVDTFNVEKQKNFYKHAYKMILSRIDSYVKREINYLSLEHIIEDETDNDIISYNTDFKINIEDKIINEEVIRILFSNFNEKEKDILIMYLLKNITQEDIAKKYNVTQSAVCKLIQRLLQRLLIYHEIYEDQKTIIENIKKITRG